MGAPSGFEHAEEPFRGVPKGIPKGVPKGLLKICSKFTGEHPRRTVNSCKLAAYFQNTFLSEEQWRAASEHGTTTLETQSPNFYCHCFLSVSHESSPGKFLKSFKAAISQTTFQNQPAEVFCIERCS